MKLKDPMLRDFLYGGPYPKNYPSELRAQLLRRLQMLKAATRLSDLRVPPGNRLEALRGNLQGYWSIRVNQQYRLVFRWDEGNKEAIDVRFEDYH